MSAKISVYVTPKSSRNEIAGWRGGELSAKVTAPPEGGKANAAVCKLLARELGVPKSAVTVVRGQSARHKQLEIDGIGDADVIRALGTPE